MPLCKVCGKSIPSRHTYCDEHAEAARLAARRRFWPKYRARNSLLKKLRRERAKQNVGQSDGSNP